MPPAQDTAKAGRISHLEDYIKTHIDIDKKLTAEGGDQLAHVLSTRTANEAGVIRLFAAALLQQRIPFQIVLASDRTGIPLDPGLEDWDRADDVLLYFPSTGAFLDPTQEELRYPLVRASLAGVKGLFLTTGDASFNMVPLLPWDSSGLNMEADLRFSPGLDTLLVHGRQIMTGYGAAEYRPIYAFLPQDKQDEESKDIVRSIGNSQDVSNIHVSHPGLTEALDNTPLVIEADLRCPDLIEEAGNRILLKIGEIIGTQTEMYQERPRQLPAEMPFPHEENRTITLHVPDGYTVKNLNDLLFNVTYPLMGFTATYTQKGSEVVISIHENYRTTFYPLAQFEHFKKVINTSADFNKVVLVLEKKG
jgi:hypothetical protein